MFRMWKSGTVIDAVSYFENVSIGEAIKILQNKPVKIKEIKFLEVEKLEEDLKLDMIIRPLNETSDRMDRTSLNDIAEEYHKNLLKSNKALEYLKSRGITDSNIITDYKIGFSDGSLKDKLSKNQIEELKSLGIFSERNIESFINCITFPVFDENQKVVGLYGRSINDSVKVKHLYLKGSHKSVFNRKTVKVYPEQIILTECIIDAVSLIQADIKNVWACYGVNGFTPEMKELLKVNRVKEIVIAFDKDEAGINGAEKLKQQLIDNNFAVRCIFPPDKKDWNEEVVYGITREDILSLIDNAELFKSDKSNKITYEVKGDTYYFTAEPLEYRVIGFKGNFTTELKLNFRTYLEGKSIPSVFNIYSDRALEIYIKKISEEFLISQEIIKEHFNSMIEIFEDERERILSDKEKKFDKKVYVLTLSEEKEALDILTGSDLINDHLLPDTEKLGLVGEELNKRVCYLAIISRNWRRPLNVCTLSTHGTGKSFLHDTMHKFVPDEDLKSYSRITKNDLYYREEDNAFDGKVLSIDEIEGLGESLYSIRTLISSGVLSISYPSMDPVTGRFKNEENKVFGRPTVFCTGTSDDEIDAETKSRFLILTTDVSNEQKFRIKKQQFYEMSLKGVKEKRLEDEIVKKHKNILRLLKNIHVVFPQNWQKKLIEIESGYYTVRDNLSYLSIIASFVIMEQFKRKIYTADDKYGKFRVAEVTKEDIINTNNIMLGLFGKSLSDLSPPQKHFFDVLLDYAKAQIKGKNLTLLDITFYERSIREYSGLSAWHVNKYLNELVKLEYAAISNIERHNRKVYKLIISDTYNDDSKYLSGLIDVNDL